MSNFLLTPRSALHNAQAGAALRTQIAVDAGLTIASVAARKGQSAALSDRILALYGMTLPTAPRWIEANGMTAIWAGPDQWLLTAENTNGRDLEHELMAALDGMASITDQSDNRSIAIASGPKAAADLAKGIAIDLHDRAFKPGDVAITQASHIPVLMWRLPDRDPSNEQAYKLACPRSYAASMWAWLVHAATAH